MASTATSSVAQASAAATSTATDTTPKLSVFATDRFEFPLPEKHRFPIAKYRRLRERLEQSELADAVRIAEPDGATDAELALVHDAAYLRKLREADLTAVEQRRLGFPWSPQLLERSRRSTGATVAAARAALANGVGVNLAGGTHHAFPDHGQGFCVFNDVAVAASVLFAARLIRRAVVIDCDVHQGNGTAAIFRDNANVFTCSMHGARNFPFSKCGSDLDVELPDGTTDDLYLAELDRALDCVPLADADCVFYLAGADPYEGDRYGRLKLTKPGLAERDRRVLAACRRSPQQPIPVVIAMAGGYAPNIEDIVDIHFQTVRAAAACLNESVTG